MFVKLTNDMNNDAFLLLGSNLGDTNLNLQKAITTITQIGQIIGQSSVYRTKAWGLTDQPDFYNQVVRISTSLGAEELLAAVLTIESTIGRERKIKWGPRTIDIDILFYGDSIIELKNLEIPHPEISNRRFVLVPLAEIAPDLVHPKNKKNIRSLLDLCTDTLAVEKLHI